jgi:hypothetical protein
MESTNAEESLRGCGFPVKSDREQVTDLMKIKSCRAVVRHSHPSALEGSL